MKLLLRLRGFVVLSLLILFFSACKNGPTDGNLLLPDGFSSAVVIDSISESVRHMAVTDDGVIYAKLRNATEKGVAIALKDSDGDVRVDQIERFGMGRETIGTLSTSMRIYNGYLYTSSELVVYRQKLIPGSLLPDDKVEVILTDDHEHGRHEHIAKPIAFDNQGNMYVPFGAPSNACQDPKRTPGAPGIDPCPQLEDHAGVWRFDANRLGQTQKDGYKYASGIRSLVAMNWNPFDKELYAVMHGRDDLLRLWPNLYTPHESALLPSEEFIKVTEGSNFGWPYCYYDQVKGAKVLGPEYGGDGEIVGRCAEFDDPIIGFPGHWAPNDLLFYQGGQFPERYKNGAFIAFHGSTNRAPYPQSGYIVGFVPFKDGKFSDDYEVFADGFAEVDPIINTKDAAHRPMGLAVGPDGELYISDSVKGKIWKVTYDGKKEDFKENQLLSMEERKKATHVRSPDIVKDNLMKNAAVGGEKLYYQYCSACHQLNGKGASGRFPSLVDTDWVTGSEDRLIEVLLKGMVGSLEINGEVFNGVMPQHSFLKDKEVAQILTYIRSNFGNKASEITEKQVSETRKKHEESTEDKGPIRVYIK